MKAPTTHDFACLIGIDWADTKHDLCETDDHGETHTYGIISSKPEAIHKWVISLKKRYPNQQIAISCELKKGPLVHALLKYDHITIFSINPSTVAKYRKAFVHSGAKDDPSDAKFQVDILRLHMDKLRAIEPDAADIRALAQLVEYRRKLVQDRVDLSNRITSILKSYYPQVLDWFKERDTIIFCEFVNRWPDLATAKRARKNTLINFFNQHNSRYPATNEKRIESIKSAFPLTDDPGVVEPNSIMIKLLVPQLKLLIEAIEEMDKEIRTRYRAQKDRVIFDSFPGAGPQLAPRLLVAFGSNRSRYETAADMQKYAGVAPVIERSGKKSWTHWRYSCPKFLRQTFVEWAGQSVRFSFWAKAYYQQQMEKGKPHNTAIRSLAFKWIRIAFSCWKTRTVYDESKYLEALKQRGSPLLQYAVNS
jgi:transposase